MIFRHVWDDVRTCLELFLGSLGCFLDVFGMIVGHVWDGFWTCLGCFLDMFGMIFGDVWDVFWSCLGCFLDMFGMIFGHVWDVFLTVSQPFVLLR